MKSPEIFNERGFTIVEILIMVTISSLIAVSSLPIYGNLQSSTNIRENAHLLIQNFRLVRERAESGFHDLGHGIKFRGDNYVLYQGPSFSSRDSDFDRIINPKGNVTFMGSIDEVNFSKGLAEPDATGTIMIQYPGGKSIEVEINSLGIADLK
jgi:type II secretory pathway pseudopilin PulG